MILWRELGLNENVEIDEIKKFVETGWDKKIYFGGSDYRVYSSEGATYITKGQLKYLLDRKKAEIITENEGKDSMYWVTVDGEYQTNGNSRTLYTLKEYKDLVKFLDGEGHTIKKINAELGDI